MISMSILLALSGLAISLAAAMVETGKRRRDGLLFAICLLLSSIFLLVLNSQI